MAMDPLQSIRLRVGARVAEIQAAGQRLSPLDLYARLDAIRELANANGLVALEALAHRSAQLALLPGHRVAVQSCLEHVGEALDSRSVDDGATILAAVALRLH